MCSSDLAEADYRRGRKLEKRVHSILDLIIARIQLERGVLHGLPIRLTAHDDPDQWLFHPAPFVPESGFRR